MKTFGVTGGIGMGKSTVASMLVQRGVKVVDTDELAREVVRPGQPALAEIAAAFGSSAFGANGELDRERLATVVFSDPAARKRLEAILHPRIQELWQAQVAAWGNAGHGQAAVVIPLLFETQVESHFDLVVCLACSSATQQQRLRERGWTLEQIQQRNAAQMPVVEKLARAQRVIWNEGDLEMLSRQCSRIFSPD